MKKLFYAVLLSASIVLAILPTISMPAMAAVDGVISIGRNEENSSLSTNLIGEGWSWVTASDTLTLTGNYTGEPISITTVDTQENLVKLVVEGEVEIYTNSANALCVDGSLEISGSGSLTLTSINDDAISISKSLTINDCKVTAHGNTLGNPFASGISVSEKMTVNEGTVIAHSSGYGINSSNGLSINGGAVTAYADDNNNDFVGGGTGIYSPFGELIINSGNVTAYAGNGDTGGDAIVVSNITINNGNLTATGGDVIGFSYGNGGTGIYVNESLIIAGGTVHANGGTSYNSRSGDGIYVRNNFTVFGGTVTANGGFDGGVGIVSCDKYIQSGGTVIANGGESILSGSNEPHYIASGHGFSGGHYFSAFTITNGSFSAFGGKGAQSSGAPIYGITTIALAPAAENDNPVIALTGQPMNYRFSKPDDATFFVNGAVYTLGVSGNKVSLHTEPGIPVTITLNEPLNPPKVRISTATFYTLQEAIAVVRNNSVVELLRDINLEDGVGIHLSPDAQSNVAEYTLDLGNYTITGSKDDGGLLELDGETTVILTAVGGGIKNNHTYGYAMAIDGSSLNIIGGTYIGGNSAVLSKNKSSVVIAAGVFTAAADSNNTGAFVTLNNGAITIASGSIVAPEAWDSVATKTVTVTQNHVTKYEVTANGSFAALSGSGSYAAGEIVTISAGTRNDYIFVGWVVNNGAITLADEINITTTFTMPADAVCITANWVMLGDIDGNGIISISDVAAIYQHVRSRITLTGEALVAADVIGADGRVTIADVTAIYQRVRNKITSFS